MKTSNWETIDIFCRPFNLRFTMKKPDSFFANLLAIVLLVTGLGFISVETAHAQAASNNTGHKTLKDLIGKKRVLLLFAKSRSSAKLDKQIDLFRERRPDVSERDLVVLVTAGRDNTMAAMGYVSLAYGTERHLRERFKPSQSGLTVVLVGKDGGEKARFLNVVQPDVVFALIDAMPMRQREMQSN